MWAPHASTGKAAFLALLAAAVGLSLTGCSRYGPHDGFQLDCEEYCWRTLNCCHVSCGSVPEVTEDCVSQCEIRYEVIREEIQKGVAECFDLDRCEYRGFIECVSEVEINCQTVMTSTEFESLCQKMVECNVHPFYASVDECMSDPIHGMLDCDRRDYIVDFLACRLGADCENYSDDVYKCMRDRNW